MSNLERVWICDECDHIFTEDQKIVHDEAKEWGHPCKMHPRSKKYYQCEAYLKPYVPEETQ